MPDLDDLLYEPKTPVIPVADKDLNEVLLGDDELDDEEDDDLLTADEELLDD